ncbi:hypothetical protein Tco_1274917 [Tanacetum coccineum]
MQLRSILDQYKSKTEEVTILKKDFKQTEDKYLEEFLDMKKLKDKVEDRLYKQDQSVQTVNMLYRPNPFYDERKCGDRLQIIPYVSPHRAKQVQSALYNGTEIVMTNHKPAVVHESEETLAIAESSKAIFKEVKEMEESFDQMSAEVDQNTVDKQCVEIERKNLLIANENLIANFLSNQLLFAVEQPHVNSSTVASRSKPRSNTKNNRYRTANSVNQKTVKDYPMTNKSVWTKVNRVDSSISSKRVVINLNSESVCKMCNKCLIFVNHDMCALKSLNSVNATPLLIILNKEKHIWKQKGKLSDNSLKKTKRVWKATSKLFANVGYQWRPTGKKFSLGEQCPLTKHHVKCCSKHMTRNHSKLKNFVEKFIGTVRFGNDHFGAIMGYGDYVYGDSVIFGVYYVEELGHNLFSIGQFCDSDLEIAFRKHSCFVHDMNGVDLLKGSRFSPIYTDID